MITTDILKAKKVLTNEGIVAIPTETVYVNDPCNRPTIIAKGIPSWREQKKWILLALLLPLLELVRHVSKTEANPVHWMEYHHN